MQYVLEKSGDTVMLSFSAGKDSVAAWLALRRYFKTIVPVYMYLVPGLRLVEEGLRYYEDFFETHIIRLPNPTAYEMMNAGVHQTPDRILAIEESPLPTFSKDEVFQLVREDWGLPESTFVAMGVRAADSPNRRSTIMKYGSVNENRNPPTFQPVWDWNKARLIDELKAAGAHLTDDYRLFGRSFDGIDFRFLYPLKRHYPDDYERILEWFPLADADIARWEFHKAHKQKGWY